MADEEVRQPPRCTSPLTYSPQHKPVESMGQPQYPQWHTDRVAELKETLVELASCYLSDDVPTSISPNSFLQNQPYVNQEPDVSHLPDIGIGNTAGSLTLGQDDCHSEVNPMIRNNHRQDLSSQVPVNSIMESTTPTSSQIASGSYHRAYSKSILCMCRRSPKFAQLTDAILAERQYLGNSPRNKLCKPIHLHVEGNLSWATFWWTANEIFEGRRILCFARERNSLRVLLRFKYIQPEEWAPDMIAVSCIFDRSTQKYYVTTTDCINLLEFVFDRKLSIEEKNRIRRNLQVFKPMTISEHNLDHGDFFRLIMGFRPPRPRNIMREIKVIPWNMLEEALKKIVSKYCLVYRSPLYDEKAAYLHLEGDLASAVQRWTTEEVLEGRRILWFTREQHDFEIILRFRPIKIEEWAPGMATISCILYRSKQCFYFTTADYINFLEFILNRKLDIEEKNRTRRNLDIFNPMTISRQNPDHGDFFSLIMNFPPPRPRNIVREIKVIPWNMLEEALDKIVSRKSLIYDEKV